MSTFIARQTLQAPSAKRGDYRRRGMMLVVTLVIVTLLALLGASFAFRMNADVAAVSAQHDLQQARQAAESGLDRAIMILREHRTDMDEWYNNPKSFRRILVWSPDKRGGSESVADQEKVAGRPAWRFSIISYRLDGDNAKIRYGVSDEAGKININTASRAQLIALFDNVKHEDNVTSIDLADAILNWRGDEGVPEVTAAKLADFYNKQNPSYKPKQRPFETVEELLMVKGFDGQLVYGEDYNRNGYLDPNEDDGQDGAFPPDDGDGKLNRGLLPLVTCYSWDRNASNDNRQRVNINMANLGETPAGEGGGATIPGMSVRELLSKEIRPEVLDFIADARKRNFKFRSVGELVGLEVYQDGSSNYDREWRRFLRQLNQANKAQADEATDGQDNQDQEGGRDAGNDSGGDRNRGGRDTGGGSGDNGRNLGPRRDNTRTSEDRNNEKNKEKDTGGSGGSGGRSDAGFEGDTIVLAGFNSGASIFPRVIPSILLASVDPPVSDTKDARKLQSARGSGSSGGRSSGSRSGSSRSGSSRTGGSRSGGGRSFGLDEEEKGPESGSGSSSGSSSGRGSGRGSSAGGSRGGSAGGSTSGDPEEGSGSGRTGGRRGGSRGSEGSGSGASGSGGRRSGGRGSGTEGVGGESGREGGTGPGEEGTGVSGGRGGGRDGGRRSGSQPADGEENNDNAENEPQQDNNGAGGGTGGGGRGTPIVSPVTADDLPALLDRLTTLPMPVLAGQINVNTAPVEVLRTLPGVGEAEAEAIVAKRAQLSGPDKSTPAWLVTSGALPAEQFALISNLLTARSLQYTVESIGFADHVGAAKRIQAVVEFKGQMAQIKYYRDITSLGIGYPVHDDERSQGFAFSDR